MKLDYEIVLWGRKQGEGALQEQIITSTNDTEHLSKARQWALANGYAILRESRIDGTLPNFADAINL